ncbi:sensor histidine kinase [Paenibacillus methanolicus]|uniref:histidine kinase n=1 Tax=Paenibacillus methanolicus TaxID=582686 RepID=A0A5S5C4E9_9BACL|nr:HAMP domain-containing sensor histidine kinase [Paenibacillus methanolicus]TYP74019.1 signal transduction histidine kinase [Paenibacillus methanolicus]
MRAGRTERRRRRLGKESVWDALAKRRSRPRIAARIVGVVVMLFLSAGVAFSIAYWLTGGLLDRIDRQWTPYWTQLATALIGMLIMMLSAIVIGLVTGPKQRLIWGEIIDALRRIAKGDFNVTLDKDRRMDGQWGDFVQTINHMASELKQMEQLRQEFISNVSHEIGSPLTSIRGFAHALQNESLTPEERKHYLSIIETESMRLSKLSDNLLKLTSLESAHQPFEPRVYRLDAQLRNVVLACEPQWLEKELELALELSPVTIEADEETLSQVWNNLIVNAVKFSERGGELTVRLAQSGDEAVVEVRDTGCGIAEEDRKRIFERFFKGDKSRTRTAGGSGLGLSIASKIVELHGGTIGVRSRPGEGATFTVRLPIKAKGAGFPASGEAPA